MKFSGTVIHGDGYGRVIGYPTINIDSADYEIQGLALEAGIYAGKVVIEDGKSLYHAALVVSGTKAPETLKLEAHLLDFSGDLYDQVVTFYPLQFIRPYQQYADESELISAIAEDMIKIRMLCSQYQLRD